ncbi:MAG: hypothetical protein J3K34DRAFT_480735 [Monoraphidium minutum]|nr:MAG: hypothetical protein J3K34DRAFT_480735 [Monoraphidium minutum]
MGHVHIRRTGANLRDSGKGAKSMKDEGDASDDEISAAAAGGGKAPQRSFAQQVVREIHAKWRAQARRAAGYRRLFSLLAFIALLLGVLYAQRGAAAAFRVNATLASVVGLRGDAAVMHSPDAVYDWLGGVLEAVWKDPTCGDGLCESPFEFASYGRFGCRADCGNLMDLQALTSLDIDLYWDFGHQAGSLPASELMSQASWNLCPENIQYNSDCYYQEDQAFTTIAGSLHTTLPDIPDGDWSLRVKRDLMGKVRGAVRSTARVAHAAVLTKVYVAATAVAAEQAQEVALLTQAAAAARTPLLEYLPTMWSLAGGDAAGRDEFDAAQMRNASCLCAGAAAALEGTAGFVDEATLRGGGNCTGITQLSDRAWHANGTNTVTTPPTIDATICATAAANLTAHRNAFNATLLSWLVTQRLGNLATTGKIANRTAVIAALRAALDDNHPELVAPVFTAPKGNDALGAPADATLPALAALFVDAPSFLASGPPAYLSLFRRRLTQDEGVSFTVWADRAEARIAEIADQQAQVAGFRAEIGGVTSTSVASVTAAYAAAGANASWVPPTSAPGLGGLAAPYDLAAWPGGAFQFVSCDLPRRAPEYVGACQAKSVACAPSAAEGVPYACTLASDNSSVAGNLSSGAYREACELPCDLELDCAALCDCGDGGCGEGEVCSCQACRALQGDAAADGEFMTIAAAAASSGSTAAIFAPINAGGAGRRRLAATSNDEVIAQLALVSGKVDGLRAAQDAIAATVDGLRGRVDTANLLAEARAANTRVQDLITAGRADVASGQAALEAKLDTLLQRQQAALDAARTASAALAAVQGMAERQVAALTGLDAAVKEQVKTISVATQQGLISLSTALSYWKVARRNRAAEAKLYRLANTPCSAGSVGQHPFSVSNGNGGANDMARDRSVGLNNRIVGGILLHTWRAAEVPCPATRFSAIQSTCSGPLDVSSYGVDPAFKPGTSSFQADLAAPGDGPMLAAYDCGGLSGTPTYGGVEPATGLAVNPEPYCAELYNARSVPYGFHHFPLPGAPPGFPVWLDINLSQGGAATWLAWLRDALLLDGSTRGLAARFVTYNAELRVFGAVKVDFDFGTGGTITATPSISALRLELYDPSSPADAARYAAEVLLTACVGLMVAGQGWAAVRAAARPKGLRRYWSSPAHVMDATSNLLLAVCCGLWWLFATRHARTWSMELRYNVYSDLAPTSNFLDLSGTGEGLASAWAALRGLEAAVSLVGWYYALSGINVLLLQARLLRRMDFQPRLGVITRSLRLALPDLLHFALVAGAVFLGYSVMGFLIFGSAVPQFAGLGTSINTCFQMMLGEFGDVFGQLGQLRGVQGVAAALFFWTYMLLVFLVLLNFLLAIIVDAFSEVKERTSESTGIHTELARLAADQWRGLLSMLPGRPARAGRRKLDALLRSWGGDDDGGRGGGGAAVAPGAGSGDESGGEDGGKGEGGAAGADDDGDGAAGGGGGGRTLRVLGQRLDEAALRAVLSEVLAPFDAVDDPAAPKPKGAAAAASSGDEVGALARFVLRRHGSKAAPQGDGGGEDDGSGAGDGGGASLEAERDRLAAALEGLADVQRELAEAQRQLMAGQKQLAEQQARLMGGGDD